MKKLLALLAITVIAITSTFAISFDGSSQSAPRMNVTLKSTLDPTSYDLSLVYGTGTDASDFTATGEKVIDGLDLTKEGSTKEFNVIISDGNLNKAITFVTTISEKPFVGLVNGKKYETNNNLTVRNADTNQKQTTFSTEVPAGPQDTQSVAKFDFHWDSDTELPAGDYATTNTISISVN